MCHRPRTRQQTDEESTARDESPDDGRTTDDRRDRTPSSPARNPVARAISAPLRRVRALLA
jgi:hypothetical protein